MKTLKLMVAVISILVPLCFAQFSPLGSETVPVMFSDHQSPYGYWPYAYNGTTLSADGSTIFYTVRLGGPNQTDEGGFGSYRISDNHQYDLWFGDVGFEWPSTPPVQDPTNGNIWYIAAKDTPGVFAFQYIPQLNKWAKSVLKDFSTTNYGYPEGKLLVRSCGSHNCLYGTAVGDLNVSDGIAYKIDLTTFSFTKLVDFPAAMANPQGVSYSPCSGATCGAGFLFGITTGTGINSDFGTVWKINLNNNTLTQLYTFTTVGLGGVHPVGIPWEDASGNVYGTAFDGGQYDAGTIYKISPSGVFSVVFTLSGSVNGTCQWPYAGLAPAPGSSSLFYGACFGDGSTDAGAVFSVTSNGIFQIIYAFTIDDVNGYFPETTPTVYSSGGITYVVGTTQLGGGNGGTNGVIYKVTP